MCDRKKLAPKIRASLCITGENMDFEFLNSEIGVQANYFRKKEEFPKVSRDYGLASDEWAFKTEQVRSYDIADAIKILVEMFKGREGKICKICTTYGFDVCVVISLHAVLGSFPVIDIPKDCIEFLHRIGASEINLDPYIYEDSFD